MIRRLQFLLIAFIFGVSGYGREYHVVKTGNDNNSGTIEMPLLTIQAASNLAQPGDVITVHEGVYHEEIIPPHGGESAQKPIVYQAAPGENVSIRGSGKIEKWVKQEGNVVEVWPKKKQNNSCGI